MFSTQRNWLTGLNRYDVENAGADNLIYTSSNGTVRLTLQNGKRAESKDLFAAAPNRVKYKQEIVKFYPSLQVFGPPGTPRWQRWKTPPSSASCPKPLANTKAAKYIF